MWGDGIEIWAQGERTDVKFLNVKEKLVMHLKINNGWKNILLYLYSLETFKKRDSTVLSNNVILIAH